MKNHADVSFPHAGGCVRCRAEGRCNYCGAVESSRCTNGRCLSCHGKICTPGGNDSAGHGYGKVGHDWRRAARKEREAEGFVGFSGDRVPDAAGPGRVYVIGAGAPMELDPRYDLRNHSPDGFNWGYGGSGPAQLALAICANAVGEKRAQRVYQDFKFKVVAGLPDAWELSRADVVRIIEQLEAEDRARAER